MAWLLGVPDAEMPNKLAEIVKAQYKQYGTVLNSTRMAAHIPDVQLAMSGMSRALTSRTPIPPRLNSLINLRVAAIVGCPL